MAEIAPAIRVAADIVRERLGALPADMFAPFLDAGGALGGGPAVHLLQRLEGQSDAFGSVCAMGAPAEDGDDAPERLFQWMWSRPDRWTPWGRIAVALGAGVLASQVEREFGADGPGRDRADNDDDDEDDDDVGDDVPRFGRHGRARLREPDPEEDRRVWCCCGDDRDTYSRVRGYRLYLRRGHSHPELVLFNLWFDAKGPRDRVWDWMQHQTHRYDEFVEHLEASSKDSLKKLIFAGMLETERAVKKAGMGSGGTRPLRFWPGPGASDA